MLIFADSRGRKLSQHLAMYGISVYFYPGAKLLDVFNYSCPIIRRLKPSAVLYMAGINDLTLLQRNPFLVSFRYASAQEMISAIIPSITSIRSDLHSEFPELTVMFSGIIGMNLNHYNALPGFHQHQWSFNEAIIEINRLIAANNTSAGAPHPHLTSKVHKWHKGRPRHQYRLLPDGLHPGTEVVENWTKVLVELNTTLTAAAQQ